MVQICRFAVLLSVADSSVLHSHQLNATEYARQAIRAAWLLSESVRANLIEHYVARSIAFRQHLSRELCSGTCIIMCRTVW